MDGVPEFLHHMGFPCPCKRVCQGITAPACSGLGGCPHPCHEMGFGMNIAESGILQPLVDVIDDEIPVVGLMEHASEIVHGHIELR